MKRSPLIISALLILTGWPGAVSASQVEPDYDPSKPLVTNPWYGRVGAAERAADLHFIEAMRPHHAGALTMAEDYLKNTGALNEQLKRLARGIIHNQTFEISMLDTVDHYMRPAVTGPGREWRQIARQGLAQDDRFVRAPIPGPLDRGAGASVEDVKFAKAMIVHHQAALDMARDYLANDAAQNRYLRLLCIDILRDQAMEISFMKSVIALYDGNPDDIKLDPAMIHGMDHMKRSGAHKGGMTHDMAHDMGHGGHAMDREHTHKAARH